MTNEQKNWKLVESLKWGSDHNYRRIAAELSHLDENTFKELKRFVNKKTGDLGDKYRDAWLGMDDGPGIDVSDDGWSDLRYEVVGRGKEFYNSITVEKLREMADNYDYHESFCYCFLK